MTISAREVIYEGPGGPFEGYVAYDEAIEGRRPGVMVVHNWIGQDDFDNRKAVALAELGYVGFAIDLYGQAKRGPEICEDLRQRYDQQRDVYQARSRSALSTMRGFAEVDPTRTAAIGFCLGGKAVLDLARSGSDINGVVSFHGTLHPPLYPNRQITTKVLVLHGWEDPIAKPDSVIDLANELNDANVDWQIHLYGRAMHAFTMPYMDLLDRGAAYDAIADRRSWQTMKLFLEEVFR